MGKKPYHKPTGLGGAIVAIAIGIIGMIGNFLSHYGYVLIPIILAFYLYVRFSKDSDGKTETKTRNKTEGQK